MRLSFVASLAAATLSLSLAACSKHECDFKNDAEKTAFGPFADMTEGAFNCGLEGESLVAEMTLDTRCEIGAANCVPKMTAIHAAPATVKDVATKYKAFLEKGQWKVEEETVKSKYASGKDIEGIALHGSNGDKGITVMVFPFGDDMVETRTYLAALKKK